jgi:hypothetical protein
VDNQADEHGDRTTTIPVDALAGPRKRRRCRPRGGEREGNRRTCRGARAEQDRLVPYTCHGRRYVTSCSTYFTLCSHTLPYYPSPPRTSNPMLNQTPPNRLRSRLLRQSDSRVRGSLRHDEGSRPHGDLDCDDAADDKHVAPQLGDVAVLLWHAGGPISHDVCAAAVQHWADPRRRCGRVGGCLYAYCGRDDAPGAVCSAVFSGLRRIGYSDRVHVCD